MSTPTRLAPLAGIAGIGCAIAGLATDAAPTSQWSDARITAWYGSHSTALWFVSAYLLALSVPFLLVFATVVRDRLTAAGASTLATGIAHAAGITFAVALLVGDGLYAGVPAAMAFSHAPAPGADASRFLLGAAYGVLVMFSAFAAALFAATVSITCLRHRAIPRWLAVAGIPAALLMLANAVAPMAVITLWFLAVSIALTARPRPARTSVGPAPATVLAAS